ncbi:protein-export chaperone SecB [Methanococcus maripaludis]|uniref:Preprotein translocase subunit SecB n=1 Tax=Methanococcus maripaludis TaxID=39152 RepID=A0A7J9S3T3_METMI|nr:protein-export chaperone SecB [Methanococcus maripaludis]MBB6068188.1 preprotein translocase subunit SecB [Methanococcus maripaludis]
MQKSCAMKFLDYNVDYIEFYDNPKFEVGNSVPVEMDLACNVKYENDEYNTMHVTMLMNLFKNTEETSKPFTMNVAVTGHFQLEHSDPKIREQYAKINAVSILFPYIRALVSTCTAAGNVGSMIIPPINVLNMFEEQEK